MTAANRLLGQAADFVVDSAGVATPTDFGRERHRREVLVGLDRPGMTHDERRMSAIHRRALAQYLTPTKPLPSGPLQGPLPAEYDLPVGFKPLGYVSEDGILHEPSAEVARRVYAFDQERASFTVRAEPVQPRQRRDLAFSLFAANPPRAATAADRLREKEWHEKQAALWQLVFGIDLHRVQPARPTVREAWQDALDAVAALVVVLVDLIRPLPRQITRRVREGAEDAYDVSLDALEARWYALRAPYPWRRLPGPVVRLWNAEFDYLHTHRFPPEGLRVWLRRLAVHVWEAVRHG